jgi:multimeric flavodoxin WrbA
MRTVLGIVGSPRSGGNTHALVSAALEGAKEAGAVADLVLLGGLTIRECDGCHICWQGKPCPKDDDMPGLYARLAEADAIVFGTPVYWYGPTALMKAFIDRLVYFNCPENRPKIRGKSAALVVPFEESDPETAAPLVAMFGKCFAYLELKPAGQLLSGGLARRGEVLQRPDLLAQAHTLGLTLARGGP